MHSFFESFKYIFNYSNLYLKESIYRYSHNLEPFDKRMNVPLLLSIPILFGFFAILISQHKLVIAILSIITTPSASSLFTIAAFESNKGIKRNTLFGFLFGLACFDKFYIFALLPSVLFMANKKIKFIVVAIVTWTSLFMASACLLHEPFPNNIVYQLNHTYIAQLDPDYHPNLGIWWYILQQMFDQYRPLYVFVMWSHLFVYQYPIMKMCKEEPLFALWLNLILIHIFSPNPSFFDILILWNYVYKFQVYHKCTLYSYRS